MHLARFPRRRYTQGWTPIEKLERLVGRLTLENEFLKKGLQNSLSQSERNGKLSAGGDTSSAVSGKDAA
jgi:hypothetical protein